MAYKDNKTMKFFREDLTQRHGSTKEEEEFFREDFTRRRGGTEDAEKEKEEGLKKPLNKKLSYPEARMFNDELTNNNSAPQRLCERKFGIVSSAPLRLRERKFGVVSSASLRICVSILFILVLISCQSVPDMSGDFLEDANFLPLESGASVYILADAREARSVISLLPIQELSEKQVVQILDKTEVFAAALFPQEDGKRYQIAAWGNYPSFQASLALGANKDWQKKRSAAGGNYWHSQGNRLSLAMSSRQVRAVVSADSEPADPVTSSPGMEIPEGFNEFRRNSIFSCWLESPHLVINRIMSDIGLPFNSPVKKLFISLAPIQEEKYEASIRLQFDNTSFARAMTVLLNGAYIFLHGNTDSIITSIFFANPPAQNGSNVDIKTAVLDEERIVQLLGLFALF